MKRNRAIKHIEKIIRWSRVTPGNARFMTIALKLLSTLKEEGYQVYDQDKVTRELLTKDHVHITSLLASMKANDLVREHGLDGKVTSHPKWITTLKGTTTSFADNECPLLAAFLYLRSVSQAEIVTCMGCFEPLVKLSGKRVYHNDACKQKAYRREKRRETEKETLAELKKFLDQRKDDER